MLFGNCQIQGPSEVPKHWRRISGWLYATSHETKGEGVSWSPEKSCRKSEKFGVGTQYNEARLCSGPCFFSAASRASKSISPPQAAKILAAGVLGRKTFFKLNKRARVIDARYRMVNSSFHAVSISLRETNGYPLIVKIHRPKKTNIGCWLQHLQPSDFSLFH